MLKIIFTIAMLFLLSSCGSMFAPVKTGTENKYELNTVPSVAQKKTHAITLLVLQPETNPIYDTTQIAYTVKPYQVAYFSKNRWAKTPGQMLQPLIIQSLQNTHYFHAVISPMSPGHFDDVLATQILELRQDFTCGPSVIRLRLRAQLIRARDSRVIATQEFSKIEVAPENSPYGGVVAANVAVAKILKQLTAFCVQSLSR